MASKVTTIAAMLGLLLTYSSGSSSVPQEYSQSDVKTKEQPPTCCDFCIPQFFTLVNLCVRASDNCDGSPPCQACLYFMSSQCACLTYFLGTCPPGCPTLGLAHNETKSLAQ